MMGIVRSIWDWLDDRTGFSELVGPIASHPVPRKSTWAYVFGSATLVAFLLQVITGIALASAYVPATDGAYESLQYITNQAPFGNLLRGLHNFGASAMIVLMGIHMIRTYLYAAYKFPREVNWLSGVVLFAVTLAMGFTGQLLRWDQDGLWSIFIATGMAGRMPVVGPQLAQFILGGETVGASTLSRFFSFHVFFIPAIIFVFIAIHIGLVLRNGISEPPQMGQPVNPKTYRSWYHDLLKREGVPFWPDAAWRDVLFGVAVIVVVFLLAWLVGPAPLGAPPDPTNLNASPRPDWYFLWLFAALALLPGWIETYVIVLGPVVIGAALILLPLLSNRGERHPLRRPWAIGIVLAVLVTIAPLWVLGSRSPWSPDFSAQPLTQASVGVASGPIAQGAQLFYDKGCQYCHQIDGQGGQRGPDLSTVGERLSHNQLTVRILGGGDLMPAFADTLMPAEVDDLVAFLESRKRGPSQ
ncbi:MAG: cytochrome b N-terminal domain-containing protein [Caldilineaceae bacterium]|nr:cytochrome b N-terminal domain-containing protein [Caldilineaceae bacterium]HRJ42178.1 cytochrome b N-terminal domain-containing protein [Caldilineaceae bacterium]